MEVELASRSGGIDGLREGAEGNSSCLQVGNYVDQVTKGTTQSIQSPSRHRITGPQLVEHRVQGGTVLKLARDPVNKDSLTAGSSQCIVL